MADENEVVVDPDDPSSGGEEEEDWEESSIVPWEDPDIGPPDDFPTFDDLEPADDDYDVFTTWPASLRGVATAIRYVTGINEQLMWPYGYIEALKRYKRTTGLGTKRIYENGTYTAIQDELAGYSTVVVNVEAGPGGEGTGIWYTATGELEQICTQPDNTGGAIVVPEGSRYCLISNADSLYIYVFYTEPFLLKSYYTDGETLEVQESSEFLLERNMYYATTEWHSPVPTAVKNVNNVSTVDEDVAFEICYGDLLFITQNGIYNVTDFNQISVKVASSNLQMKTATQNGLIIPDNGYDGLSGVIVDVSSSDAVASNNDILYHFNENFHSEGCSDCVFVKKSNFAISNAQSKFGGCSLMCNVPALNATEVNQITTDVTLGNDDFTLDLWVYPTNLNTSAYQVPIGFMYRSIAVYLKSNAIDCAYSISNANWTYDHAVAVSVPNNQWHHIAIVRKDSYIYWFFNGEKIDEANIGSNAIPINEFITIGSNPNGNSAASVFRGYIDELRLITGTAVWTDDFTPPTEPYS